MSRSIRFVLAFLFWLICSSSHAGVAATNIVANPSLSSDGSFTVTWFSDLSPDETCLYFYVEVIKDGSFHYDFEETTNCNTTTFTASGYPDGEYEIIITTVYLREDMATGDTTLEDTKANPVWVTVDRLPTNSEYLNEGVESGFDQWSNTGSYDWTRKSGKTTSSGTGPNGAAQGTFYAYMETSSGSAFYSGNTAILETGTFNLTGEEVHFKYHMYGSNMGTLYLELYNEGQWHTLWSKSGQQQTAYGVPWEDVWVPLTGYGGSGKLRFRGVAAGGYRGDMAIDDISIRFTNDSVVTEYTYDALGRLRQIKENNAPKESYQYDPAGNFCNVAPEGISVEGYCDE